MDTKKIKWMHKIFVLGNERLTKANHIQKIYIYIILTKDIIKIFL